MPVAATNSTHIVGFEYWNNTEGPLLYAWMYCSWGLRIGLTVGWCFFSYRWWLWVGYRASAMGNLSHLYLSTYPTHLHALVPPMGARRARCSLAHTFLFARAHDRAFTWDIAGLLLLRIKGPSGLVPSVCVDRFCWRCWRMFRFYESTRRLPWS